MAHTPRNIQAPNVAADFWTRWDSTNPRMALFIKITPTAPFGGSSAAIGLTSNTRDMTLPGHAGVTFRSAPGILPSAVEQALDAAANLEMTGLYKAGIFTHEEVLAGKWYFAEIEVFSACWDNVNLGEFVHFRGNLGDMKDYGYYFKAEGRGLIARLSNEVSAVTTRHCRVKEFRDAQCGHTATTFTLNGDTIAVQQTALLTTGVAAAGAEVITISYLDFLWANDLPTEDVFANGKLKLTSGDNAGVSREVTGTNVTAITGSPDALLVYVKRGFPFAVANGTSIELTVGCDRTIEACMRYSNIANRRAEDWIPGIEASNRINAQ